MMEDKFQDPIFGELCWEDAYNWWTAQVELEPGITIQTYLCGDPDQISEDIIQFRKIFENFRQNEAKARICAAQQLCETHNESWLQEDEEEITEEEFCRRIQP